MPNDTKKYFIHNRGGVEKAVIFERYKDHDRTAYDYYGFRPEEIVSAGFFFILDGKVRPFGDSFTLKKTSREDIDGPLIQAKIDEDVRSQSPRGSNAS